MKGSPQMKHIADEQLKKQQTKAVLEKLIEKRSGEYQEYFSHSSEPSIVKRPRYTSYDHIGQKRAVHLSKILRSFIAERIGSGEIGDILSGKNFQLTNIIVPVDLNRIEILWWSPEDEVKIIEQLLKTAGEELKTAIRHAQLLPNLPPVIFKRDDLQTEREQINHLLDTADKGSIEEKLPSNQTQNERIDLYDSNRTMILQKLSSNQNIDETSNNELSSEQMQRRMRAFALTKRMKRMQEQRTAMHGIMAIEKERESQTHFSLNESFDDEFEKK